MIPQLQTSHLTLRGLQLKDAETLYQIYHMEGVLRYFPTTDPPELQRVHKFIQNQERHWQKYHCGNWGLLPHGETNIIGWAGLQFLPETEEIEVGYLLNPDYWRRGFATEAAWASLQDGFIRLRLEIIIGLVHPENYASQRVLMKCGLEYFDKKTYFNTELLRYRITKYQFEKLGEK